MDVREKLVELLFKCTPKNIKLEWRGEKIEVAISQGNIADYLTAHGVMVQEIGYVVTKTDRWATYHHHCSICDEELEWKSYPNFCPNCGSILKPQPPKEE